jgi:hypothetical protein
MPTATNTTRLASNKRTHKPSNLPKDIWGSKHLD